MNSAIADNGFVEGKILSLYHKLCTRSTLSSFRNKNRYDSELPYQRPKLTEMIEIEIGLIYTSQQQSINVAHCKKNSK